MTLFENYLQKVLDGQIYYNEDIDYHIDHKGSVILKLDLIGNKKGEDKLENIKTIQELYNHIINYCGVKSFNCEKNVINNENDFVKFINNKNIEFIKKNANSVVKNSIVKKYRELTINDELKFLSHHGPVFKITATPINIERFLNHSINYFIKNEIVAQVVKEKINILNQIITNSFNKLNKMYFVLIGSEEEKKPVILDKQIHENALKNLVMCCFIDKTQRELFITTLTTMAEQILKAENERDINKAEESIGQKITTATNQYTKIIEKMPDDFKGKIEVQFYPEPAKYVPGKIKK